MDLSFFDYQLPPELIAQHPADRRDASRLMLLRRAARSVEHRRFTDLPRLLEAGDLLVVNESRVRAARLRACRRGSDGQMEVLVVGQTGSDVWKALLRPARRAKPGDQLEIPGESGEFVVLRKEANGVALLQARFPAGVEDLCERRGLPPLPPYIKRPAGEEPGEDRARYQTIFAGITGSVAAPTAGLHFSQEIVGSLQDAGIEICRLVLHVGLSTFQPIRSEQVEDHTLDAESYFIPQVAAESINRARREGRRVVAVGTTTTRTLESVAARHGEIVPGGGAADLFIHPPFTFRAVDALLTNFHLPQSSLLVLAAAFAGCDFILESYRQAVAEKYRFYSYGDCMLIL
jgi:S-adenosylmethionine:tRNA ribosyltransferase-isomerase